jgi:hypothetical protein
MCGYKHLIEDSLHDVDDIEFLEQLNLKHFDDSPEDGLVVIIQTMKGTI